MFIYRQINFINALYLSIMKFLLAINKLKKIFENVLIYIWLKVKSARIKFKKYIIK
jgi:hypothetical protein